MGDTYDLTLTKLTLRQVNILARALANYDCDWGVNPDDGDIKGISDLLESVESACVDVGLTPCDTGDIVPIADVCPNCGANTLADDYKPTRNCYDITSGGCGFWRGHDAQNRAITAYMGVG